MSRQLMGRCAVTAVLWAAVGLTARLAIHADDLPPVSGTEPYTRVSGEEPVSPSDSAHSRRPIAALPVSLTKIAGDAVAADVPADQAEPHRATRPSSLPEKPEPVIGEPLAPGMMQLLNSEIVSALKSRGVDDNFARFQSYANYKLDSTVAEYTGNELTGNCRLTWYDHLLRHPLAAPVEAEAFTRNLHTAIVKDRGGLAGLLPMIAAKLDLPKREPHAYGKASTPREAMEVVKQSIIEAQAAYAAALAPLTKSEIRELTNYLYPIMVGQNRVGHTLNDRGTGQRLCDLLEKMDRSSLISAADALVPLTDPALLGLLKSYSGPGNSAVDGVTGLVVAKIDTPAGAIVVGGKGANAYNLDAMRDVAVVIDQGGGNSYVEGTTSLERPLLVVINLGGNNTFTGKKPGIQGGSILGVSMVVNLEGGNDYRAQDVAQASTLGGVGIIVEFGGKNRYLGVRRVQAQALGGLGILIGHGTENDYHAAMWAQGLGNPLGFALLDGIGGYDHYYCGGLYPNSYKPETPGYEGCGQGVGAGLRQVANGGIGVLLSGGGHNVYEFDYLSHGGGYWCGLGFARDFGGNSKRLIARKAYDGGERSEALFQRFGCGWGCHYALGFLFDDKGGSTYEGSIMGSGMGWDCSEGVLCDFGGNSKFTAANSLTQGCGAQASLGILFQYGDNSVYKGYGQGYASTNLTYHHLPECGGNFSFLVNYGSKNSYGCGADEHAFIQRGAAGGFLISRPKHEEAESTPAKQANSKSAKSGVRAISAP